MNLKYDNEIEILENWIEKSKKFLQSMAEYVSKTLETEYVLIVRIDGSRAKTIVFLSFDNIVENIEYDLSGTPCENVADGRYCIYPSNIQNLFPEDKYLVEMKAQSYAGVPIVDSKNNFIGILATISQNIILKEELFHCILKNIAEIISYVLDLSEVEKKLFNTHEFLRESIKERTLALEESEKRFRTIVQNIPVLVDAFKYDEGFVFWNKE